MNIITVDFGWDASGDTPQGVYDDMSSSPTTLLEGLIWHGPAASVQSGDLDSDDMGAYLLAPDALAFVVQSRGRLEVTTDTNEVLTGTAARDYLAERCRLVGVMRYRDAQESWAETYAEAGSGHVSCGGNTWDASWVGHNAAGPKPRPEDFGLPVDFDRPQAARTGGAS